jgi:hypothetical protein
MALGMMLAGCAEPNSDPLNRLQAWLGAAPQPDLPAADTMASGRQAARSIWGVVPDPPRRKADLRAQLIQGSAVAVSDDRLLANCAVVGTRARVGLVRHNKYRIARVVGDRHRQVCRLLVTQGPLTPAAGFRSFADLRVGEPVIALASRTSAEVAAASGWLAGKGSVNDPFLETTASVPAGNRSVVLVDGFGNLIGLGAAAPVAGGLVLVVPLGPTAAPSLANRDLRDAPALAAALLPTPRAAPKQPPILLAVGNDKRDGADRPPARRHADLAADDPVPTAPPRETPDSGSARSGGSVGGNGNGPVAGSGGAPDVGSDGAGGGSSTGSPATDATPGNAGVSAEPGPGADVGSDDDRRGRGRGGDQSGRGDGRDDSRGDTRGRGDDGGGRGRGRGRGGDDRGGDDDDDD